MARPKTIGSMTMKMTEEDFSILEALCEMYAADKTDIVRKAIRHMLKTKPRSFSVTPTPVTDQLRAQQRAKARTEEAEREAAL